MSKLTLEEVICLKMMVKVTISEQLDAVTDTDIFLLKQLEILAIKLDKMRLELEAKK